MTENTIVRIRQYFEKDARSLGATEFKDFWFSLTELEKEYYRSVDLETGLLPA